MRVELSVGRFMDRRSNDTAYQTEIRRRELIKTTDANVDRYKKAVRKLMQRDLGEDVIREITSVVLAAKGVKRAMGDSFWREAMEKEGYPQEEINKINDSKDKLDLDLGLSVSPTRKPSRK